MLARINLPVRALPLALLAVTVLLLALLGPTLAKTTGLINAAPAPVQEVVNAAEPEAAAHSNVCVVYKSGKQPSVRVKLMNGTYANVGLGTKRCGVDFFHVRAGSCMKASFNWVPLGKRCGSAWINAGSAAGSWRVTDYN